MLAQVVDEMEYRGNEPMSFNGDDGRQVNMTLYRFEDENGMQNNFYVVDPSKVQGLNDLQRGQLYTLFLNIGAKNKVYLNSVQKLQK